MRKNNNFSKGLLLAFGEIFLKSKGVQKELKKRLINNLIWFFKKKKIVFQIQMFHERIFIQISQTTDLKKAIDTAKNTFGLVWLAKTFFLPAINLKDLSSWIEDNYQTWIKPSETFALEIKKSSDLVKESRKEIIEIIAAKIKRKVNLDHPRKKIFIEARKGGWFVYFKKQKIAGGLPVGSQGRALSLISGGIDSAVSSYLMAKRGVENIWLHFHSFPLVSRSSIEKIKALALIFLNYQPKLKIFFVPLADLQMQIKTNVLAKNRILHYRRAMFQIAQYLAKKENCQALVTGESLGQVSSQTLTNLQIVQQGIKIPILRPLIGWNKEEIISLAKKIKTFEISIQPQEDCCTLFVSKHQTAEGRIDDILKKEKDLKLSKKILAALKAAQEEFF